MLIPYNTDAPLYHYPISTGILIAINVVFFLAFCTQLSSEAPEIDYFETSSGQRIHPAELYQRMEEARKAGNLDADEFEDLTPVFKESSSSWTRELLLHYGNGLRPWQWVTSMFMHGSVMHLLGNMIFLWAFGLLLEGKMGWLGFGSCYMGLGIAQNAIEQSLMFFGEGASLGASSVIFALLALVVIFSPLNHFETVLFLGLRPLFFETPILVFCGLYVGMNLLFFFLNGDVASSEALHLLGFIVGVPVGLFLLTRGYVDCEGYDLLSHLTSTEGNRSTVGKRQRKAREKAQAAREEAKLPKIDHAKMQGRLSEQIDQAIHEGNFDLAVQLQSRIAINNPGMTWNQPQLFKVIQGYLKDSQYEKTLPLMETHIDLFDTHRFAMQSKLIKIWLHQQRPRHAMRYMQGFNPAFLSETERAELQKLAAFAKQQIQKGVLELE